MDLKRVKLIYNPKSGKGQILDELDTIVRVYQKYGYLIDFFRIEKNSDNIKLLNNIDEYEHILISGGDGTVSNYINFLKKNNIDIPIGILPLGTANDFAKMLGLSENVEENCKKIINSSPRQIDLGKINDRYFLNIASIGIFSNVSQTTDREMIKKIGKLAYLLNGIKELSKLKQEKVIIESKECTMVSDILAVLVFNGRTAGNFEIAYNAEIDDGYFDVIILKDSIISGISELGAPFKKTYLDNHNSAVKYFKTKSLKITGVQDLKTDIDGESGPNLPVVIKCIEKGIKILGIDKKFEKIV